MNKEYSYVNGTCTVRDEFGNEREIVYNGNTDEILTLENQKEELERILKQTDIEMRSNVEFINDQKRNLCSNIFKTMAYSIGISVILSVFFGNVLFSHFGIPNSILQNIFSNIKIRPFLSMVCSGAIIVLGTLLSLFSYFDYKEAVKNNNAFNMTKKEIENQLSRVNSKLCELKTACVVNRDDVVVTKKIDDKAELEKLRGILQVSFDCGYYDDEYCRYYEKGILSKKLANRYTEDGIKQIESYFEETKEMPKKRIKKL